MHKLYMHHGVALRGGRANVFGQVGMTEGKGQACKVLLPTHDAFHFYIASRFGWQLVII